MRVFEILKAIALAPAPPPLLWSLFCGIIAIHLLVVVDVILKKWVAPFKSPSFRSIPPAPTASEDLTDPEKAIYPQLVYEDKPTPITRFRGITYILFTFLSCSILTLGYLLPMSIIGALISRRYADFVIEFFVSRWFAVVGLLQELLFETKVEVAVDQEEDAVTNLENEDVLLLCNHRSEVDWFYFWNFGARFKLLRCMKIMLKDELQHVPGVGWALQMIKYPFVSRNWEQDETFLTALLKEYHSSPSPICLAMFPEGTALYHRTLSKSHDFSEAKGKPKYNYVLHPKTKGFKLVLDHFKPKYVIDMTMAFPELVQGIRPSPLRYIKGLFPSRVCMHVKTYRLSEVIGVADGLGPEEWLRKRFEEKEERLKRFYTTDCSRFRGAREAVFLDSNFSLRTLIDLCTILFLTLHCLYHVWSYWVPRVYVVLSSLYYIRRSFLLRRARSKKVSVKAPQDTTGKSKTL